MLLFPTLLLFGTSQAASAPFSVSSFKFTPLLEAFSHNEDSLRSRKLITSSELRKLNTNFCVPGPVVAGRMACAFNPLVAFEQPAGNPLTEYLQYQLYYTRKLASELKSGTGACDDLKRSLCTYERTEGMCTFVGGSCRTNLLQPSIAAKFATCGSTDYETDSDYMKVYKCRQSMYKTGVCSGLCAQSTMADFSSALLLKYGSVGQTIGNIDPAYLCIPLGMTMSHLLDATLDYTAVAHIEDSGKETITYTFGAKFNAYMGGEACESPALEAAKRMIVADNDYAANWAPGFFAPYRDLEETCSGVPVPWASYSFQVKTCAAAAGGYKPKDVPALFNPSAELL